MRSGVIAQKVGMTRVFTETGEHIPVTVLKLGNCQVLGHRTTEKNGYVALQLGSGTRKTVYLPKAERGKFPAAKVEPNGKGPEFPVPRDARGWSGVARVEGVGGGPAGTGQDFQEQEDARSYGRRSHHHSQSARGADRR